jgi:hypothetical protein
MAARLIPRERTTTALWPDHLQDMTCPCGALAEAFGPMRDGVQHARRVALDSPCCSLVACAAAADYALVMRPLLLLSAVGLSACGPITFSTQLSGQGTVAGSPLGALLSTFPSIGALTNLDFSQNQDFQNNQVTRDMVRSVRVTGLSARIVSPVSADFGFVEALVFTARAAGREAVFARNDDVAGTATRPPNASVMFQVLDVDLAPFVREPAMSMSLSGRGRQPPQDTTLEVQVSLQVEAGLR